MPQKTGFCAPALLGIFLAAAPAAAGDLHIKIDGLVNDGPVYIGLHDARNAGDFPDNPNAGETTAEPAGGETVSVTFSGLAPGEYAVSAYQDENGDGEFNTVIFGLPAEVYGFSNGARAFFGPPDFRAAAFTAGGGAHTETVTLKSHAGGAESGQ